MPLTLFETTIPVFIKYIATLQSLLTKAKEHAGLSEADLMSAQLIDDMKPLTFQIQIVSNTAKNMLKRMTKMEVPVWEDNEKTFDDCQARLAKTIDLLKTATPDCMDGIDDAEVLVQYPGTIIKFTGKSYVLDFVLPNFFFHMTTAYNLMRKLGVQIGKMDYLGELNITKS